MARLTKYFPETILDEKGPMLCTNLARCMCERHGVNLQAAKKGIERAYKKGKILRINFMTFGKGEFLYYNVSFKKTKLKKIVEKIIKQRRPIVYRLLKALKFEKILTHREALKITGLPTKKMNKKESYEEVKNYLIQLDFAFEKNIQYKKKYKFLVYKTKKPITDEKFIKVIEDLLMEQQIINHYINRKKEFNQIKNVKKKTQKGNKIFDTVGEAVSRRYMVIVYDFILRRPARDYDIQGLLDRIYSVFRKKFVQTVITYSISKKFSKGAKDMSNTGRFKFINLEQISYELGKLKIKKISGMSKTAIGEYFENTIRYILTKQGFKDVQRGLKIYKDNNKITEVKTKEIFTDIDIIMHNEDRTKVIICELKNWYKGVSEIIIEKWIKERLNLLVRYLRTEEEIEKDILAWFILSKKPGEIDSIKLNDRAECEIQIFDKIEFVNKIINKEDIDSAKELRRTLKYT